MSLIGLVSKSSVFARASGSKNGWGFAVQEEARDRWAVSGVCAGGGVLAVGRGGGEWTVSSDDIRHSSFPASAVTGHVIIAATNAPDGEIRMMRASPWLFVYEGSIADNDALCAALDVAWFARRGSFRSPSELLFRHIMAYLPAIETPSTRGAAMACITEDLHRVRSLGTLSFLCSNGASLYAYASGRALAFSNDADAMWVGSPGAVSPEPTVEQLPDGVFLALNSRRDDRSLDCTNSAS
ncbi:class II glutamine amidotransferase [Pendulispora rubella]|uniref:Class II glutamine amidotransferase n=1 Tax=Pendulispora rubella TaxID=2741070 RepID=A0ABZ2KT22_9BACT